MSRAGGTRGLFGPFMLLVVALVALRGTPASAHMMPAQQGTLNVLHDSVFEVVAVPVSALTHRTDTSLRFDDNGDGRLSAQEVEVHQRELQIAIGARFRLYDGERGGVRWLRVQGSAPITPGTLEFAMVRAEHDERSDTSAAGAKQVLVLLKTRFPGPPHALTIESDLFGSEEGEGQLTIRAKRGSESEVAILRPLFPAHRFFRSPGQLFADFVAIGVEHILLGIDHLLFLLTILVGVGFSAANRWRAWLFALTSFTIAHSLTLALAVFNLASIPVRVVECLIAASIVLSAILNLRSANPTMSHRIVMVFACGLLHGLGFASAITTMGVGAARRAVSLIGFNVGIELGQTLFLVALVLSVAILSPLIRRIPTAQQAMPKLVSVLAAILGTLWFFQRLCVGSLR